MYLFFQILSHHICLKIIQEVENEFHQKAKLYTKAIQNGWRWIIFLRRKWKNTYSMYKKFKLIEKNHHLSILIYFYRQFQFIREKSRHRISSFFFDNLLVNQFADALFLVCWRFRTEKYWQETQVADVIFYP